MAKSKTYELAIKIGGKADSSLKAACLTADKNLSELGNSAKKASEVATVAIAAIATGIAAASTALYKVGKSFDGAYDAIRIGTGATGAGLEDLKDSFKKVYTSVPAEMDNVAAAIADYNTLLGVTGGTLETLSKDALQVSDMLGEDLGGVVENSSKAFQQWNISQKNMAGTMDYVFKVSQSTGAGFSDLMTNMQTYGAQLQEMGYGFEQGAALIGQLGKEGVNVTEVLGAMKKSVTAMAKKGISATDGMRQYYDAIKNAGDATEATRIASEVFGTRAASTMAAAIRSGSMAVDDLTGSLISNGETIAGAAADTYDFSEKWAIFKHRMAVAIEPAAMTIFDKLGEVFDQIAPQIEELSPIIAQAASNFVDYVVNKIIPAAIDTAKWIKEHKTLIIALSAGIASLVGTFKALKTISTVVTTFKSLSTIFSKVSKGGSLLGKVGGLLNVKFLVIAAIIGAVVAAGILLYKNWDKIKAWATALGDKIAEIWGKIKTWTIELGAKISEVWDNIKAWVSNAVTNLVTSFQNNFPLLSAIIGGWWQSISDAWENVKAIFSNIIDFVQNVFAGNWSAAWENIVNIFGNLFGMIVNLAKVPINGVIAAINWVLTKINSISVSIPDWVPGVGGKTLGFNLPTIPALATGGVATAATLAMVGEGGEPEAILPLSKLAALLDDWGNKSKEKGNGTIGYGDGEAIVFSPVFHFHGSADKSDVEEATRISFDEFKRLYHRLKAEERRKSFSQA